MWKGTIMASTMEFVTYVCEQLAGTGEISYRKMFGEYMVYVNFKPLILICDNTAFVKIVDELSGEMSGALHECIVLQSAVVPQALDAGAQGSNRAQGRRWVFKAVAGAGQSFAQA